jgi:glutamyl-tRNA synthetase
MATGRFAPSPTGPLHLGNLRTAVVAWLFARSSGSQFLLRIEDLDPSARSGEHEDQQLIDLRALGIDWDGTPVRQSERFDLYDQAIKTLTADGCTYECFCSRREVREATRAAHGPTTHYPGTCRQLNEGERSERRDRGRPAALRFRGDGSVVGFTDRIAGQHSAAVDDVVVRRNDGTPAYNLAVVVDDALQNIDEVVRGDDLLDSTPAQIMIGRALGHKDRRYAHVPLALGPKGTRLAKRDGAVTLSELGAHGVSASEVEAMIAASIVGTTAGPRSTAELLERFDASTIPWSTWQIGSELIFAEGAES